MVSGLSDARQREIVSLPYEKEGIPLRLALEAREGVGREGNLRRTPLARSWGEGGEWQCVKEGNPSKLALGAREGVLVWEKKKDKHPPSHSWGKGGGWLQEKISRNPPAHFWGERRGLHNVLGLSRLNQPAKLM